MSARLPSILLVEDEPGDRDLLLLALQALGIAADVRVAVHGEAALHQLRAVVLGQAPAPDLIVLDLNLPRVDGKAVLAYRRGQAALRCVPVLVMTTSTAGQDRAECLALDATGFAIKPSLFDDFLRLVREQVRPHLEHRLKG